MTLMQIVFYIIWGLIGIGLIISFVGTVIYFVKHSRREKIDYDTFKDRIKYYYVQPNNIIVMIIVIVAMASGFLGLFTLLTPMAELRSYSMPFGMTFAISILIYLIYKVLEQMNQDMNEYYHNYQIAKEALVVKVKAERSIIDTRTYRKTVIGLVNDFERQILTVTDPEPYKLKESISLIDQFIEEQTIKIDGYSEDVIDRFNKTLLSFIQFKIPVALKLPNVSLNFETQYDTVRKEIYDKYRSIFNDTLVDLITSEKYKTSSIITKGLQTLKDNEYKPTQELIELILITIDSIEGSPRELVDYLVSRKIVELDELISYAINKKILWVFKSNLFESQDQLSTISERLVTEDAYNLALTFISNYFSRLKTVLAFIDKTEDQNKTISLFRNYQKVMDVDASFFNESKVLENKIISLKIYYKKAKLTTKVKDELISISKIKDAYKNKEVINRIYEEVQSSYDGLKLNAIQSLLMYSGISEKSTLLDLNKTSVLINDFYSRLLIKDLSLASLLLYGLFLSHNEDKDLHNEVIEALSNTDDYQDILQGINTSISFENRKSLSKDILEKALLKGQRKELSNIIIKLEKERLTLDKLVLVN